MDVTKLSTNARQSESLYMRVTDNQWRSDKLTVRLNSVVSWEVVGNQDVKQVLSDGFLGSTPKCATIFLLKIHLCH